MTMTRNLLALSLAAGVALAALPAAAQQAESASPPRQTWSFSGPFGMYDQAQLQRGFKIYREVCSNCHSMDLLAFRNLADPGGPGFSIAQAAALASEIKVQDGPNDAGDMFERPGRVADKFPAPFPNENAARAANGGAAPPDLSLMAKARGYERGFPWFIFDAFTQFQEKGPNYIHAILTGFEEKPPAGVTLPWPNVRPPSVCIVQPPSRKTDLRSASRMPAVPAGSGTPVSACGSVKIAVGPMSLLFGVAGPHGMAGPFACAAAVAR